MKPRLIMSDIVIVNNEEYYVADMNTKGTREILDLECVKGGENRFIVITYNRSSKETLGLSVPVHYCEKTNCWRRK